MIRRPPRSTQSRSSAASDVYKRQAFSSASRFFSTSRGSRCLPDGLLDSATTVFLLGEDIKHVCCRSLNSSWEPIVRAIFTPCLLYTSPSPRDRTRSRMPSSA
eukprot:TRINITY_DN10190_c0_g1_i1.p1 TRINITY_DN10190_c0_g1~~TRINITY_DN10190_c0_g1_i1.p1  ORF type:complete len:103 (-),score=48.52 TRINITY_DN10190_c0_g1_i1:123-431(-)